MRAPALLAGRVLDGARPGFDSFPLVLQAAVAGQGIALGWRNTVSGLIADGKLLRLCDEAVFRPTEISVFRGARRGNHAETDALLSWLREELTERPANGSSFHTVDV